MQFLFSSSYFPMFSKCSKIYIFKTFLLSFKFYSSIVNSQYFIGTCIVFITEKCHREIVFSMTGKSIKNQHVFTSLTKI